MNTALKTITKRQIKKIHALKNALKLSDDDYLVTLLYNFRKDTSKALTYNEAERLIAAWEQSAISMGAWAKYSGKKQYESLGKRPGMASPAQLRKIEAMWKDIIGIRDSERRKQALRSWLYRFFKCSDLRFLAADQVSKVIQALREMKTRESKVPQ